MEKDTGSSLEIVVDTNIIFSAFFYPDGNPRRLFKIAERRGASIIVLDYSIEEMAEVFRRKGLDFARLMLFLDISPAVRIRAIGRIAVEEEKTAKALVSDVKDRPIFAYACRQVINDRECYLVTGDRGLLTPSVKDALKGRAYTVSDFIEFWDDFRLVTRPLDNRN